MTKVDNNGRGDCFYSFLATACCHGVSFKIRDRKKGNLLELAMRALPKAILIYIYKVKLATVVEGDPKAPFSIATTPKLRGGRYSFP